MNRTLYLAITASFTILFAVGCQGSLQDIKQSCYDDAFVRECDSRGKGAANEGINDGQDKARQERNNGDDYRGCIDGVPQRKLVSGRLRLTTTTTAYYCDSYYTVDCNDLACQEGDWQGSSAGSDAGERMYEVGRNAGYCAPDSLISSFNAYIDSELFRICTPPG